MIHSARPIVTPVTNIVFRCFVLLDFEKWGRTNGRTYERTTCAKTIILSWVGRVNQLTLSSAVRQVDKSVCPVRQRMHPKHKIMIHYAVNLCRSLTCHK